jgi:photosystem II stability/assembly factor-like uncharacterized protein
MRVQIPIFAVALALAIGAGTMFLAGRSHSESTTTVHELAQQTHFHGLAVDAADPERLYLATHHGLWVVEGDGSARLISPTTDDFMGFTPHPADPSVLYASGHPTGGGNLGFIVSTDGGETWRQLSPGAGGPVDFHQMDVSAADPGTIYGAYAGRLQVSRDGGRSWEVVGPAPDGLIDLAASAKSPDILYAATQSGLRRSEDGGRTWQDAYWLRQPASMVHVTPEGEVYAFVLGSGLIRTREPDLAWQAVADAFGEAYVLHFAVDPRERQKLYAITLHPEDHSQTILASGDGGATWSAFGATPE